MLPTSAPPTQSELIDPKSESSRLGLASLTCSGFGETDGHAPVETFMSMESSRKSLSL